MSDRPAAPGSLLDEKHRWRTIYPQYINSNLTIQLGRRLPKSKCVPDPRWQEIRDVMAVNSAKFDVEAFPEKCYNREVDKENPANRGYVKYRVKDSAASEFANKRRVLVLVSQLIPKLKSRQNPAKSHSDSANVSQHPAPQSSNQSSGGSGGGGGGGGNRKKRGRR